MKKLRRMSIALSLVLTGSILSTAIASPAQAQPSPGLQGIYRTNMSPDDAVNSSVHGSTMVELSDNTLFTVWFSGDGERDGNNTKLVGARSSDGGRTWTTPFTVYDTLDFPDNNPVLYVDHQARLWLFYNVIYNGQWVSAQTKYMYADPGNYEYAARNGGNPKWHYPAPIYMNAGDAMVGLSSGYSGGNWAYKVKGSEIKSVDPSKVNATTAPLDTTKYPLVTSWYNPNDKRYVTDSFVASMKQKYDQYLVYLNAQKPYDDVYTGRTQEVIDMLNTGLYTVSGATYTKYEPPIIKNSIERASGADNDLNTWNPMYRKLGWQTKNKPIEVQYGGKTRLILPLYSDSLALSICVYTDDHGETWQMSDAIVGSGAIQGTLVQLQNGTIRGYFRSGKLDGKNGRLAWHTTYSDSTDGGATWSVAKVDPYLKNDGGFEISKLPNGDWLAATNQETKRDATQSGHRSSMDLLLSKDEGQTWKSIMIKNDPAFKETYEYPSVVVDRSGNALVNYSYYYYIGSVKNKAIGYARIEAPEITKLFGSVISATYGAGTPVPTVSGATYGSLNLSKNTNAQLTFTLNVDGGTVNDGDLVWSSDTTSVATVATVNGSTATVSALNVNSGTALITVISQKYGTIYKFFVNVTPGSPG
ncbi:exo-alpha-sialidase [Paenibacillus thalictri]|uniref:Sialidase domain-containing protein n=1 Tax=Paenibacillus thalictri TaxID=2527873 RepID=A0A4Q9DIA3_9BACL|nr:exo-alpha-sialidase [Paenibacillus thalictri]TBL71395.1 hypothetical protein EYB31_30360 [Paenibacillus thalictri]